MTFKLPAACVLFLVVGLLLGAGCSKQAKVDGHLERAAKNIEKGHYDLAESEYEAALQAQPDHPQALSRFGTMQLAQGNLVSAYMLLDKSLKTAPDDLTTRLAFGRISLALRKVPDARAAARKVLEGEPSNADALLLLAETCLTTRDNEEARRIIEQLRDANPPAAGFHVALAALRLARRDLPTAEAEIKQALDLDPKSAAAYSQLAALHLLQKNPAKAQEAFKTAAELSPLRSSNRIKYIEFLLQVKATDEAKKELAALVKNAPDFSPGMALHMKVAYDEEAYDEAIASADKIISRDAANIEALLQKAAAQVAKGDVAGGISTLKGAQAYFPTSAILNYRLARAYLTNNDRDTAEEELQQAIRQSPSFDEAILLLAELNLQKGNASATISALTQLLKRQPRIARAYVVLAQAYQAQGELDQSLKVLQIIANASPESPEGPYLIARVLDQMGKKEEARQSLDQSIRLAEDFWPALEMMVTYDLLEKNIEAARQRSTALREKFPDRAEAWLISAKVRLQENDIAGAEADLLKGLELDPAQQQAYRQLAKIYFHTNNGAKAVETLSALATKSNKASAYMQLGVLQGALNHNDESRAAYEKALAIDPKFVPAMNNLANLLSNDLSQLDKAESLANEARALEPSNLYISDTLGWILVRKGQHERALPLLRASAEKLPAEPEIQYHLGMAHYQLGQEPLARQAFQVAVSSPADSSSKDDARDRLSLLDIDPAAATAAVRGRLEKRVEEDPKDFIALTRLGAIRALDGNNAEAAELYETALKITPRAVSTIVSLSELYAGPVKNHDRARELAKAAHRIAPSDAQISRRLGSVLNKIGDFTSSHGILQEGARELSGDPEFLLELSRAYYGAGRLEQAETTLKQVLAASPAPATLKEAERHASLITATKSSDQVRAAAEKARTILLTEPNYIPALVVHALALEQTGDFDKAGTTYERILTLNPQFALATRNLAILYADRLGDDAAAEKLIEQIRQSLTDDPQLSYALGGVYYRKSDFAAATRLFRQSLKLREDHPETVFFLGMSLFQLKNMQESKAHLERALQLKLPPQEETSARQVLEEIRQARSGV